jgi:hypothetical protein
VLPLHEVITIELTVDLPIVESAAEPLYAVADPTIVSAVPTKTSS